MAWLEHIEDLELRCGCSRIVECDTAHVLWVKYCDLLLGRDPRFPQEVMYKYNLNVQHRLANTIAHLAFAAHRKVLFPPWVRASLNSALADCLASQAPHHIGERLDRDEAQVAILSLMSGSAMTLRASAEALDVPIRTVYYWRENDKQFFDAIEQLRQGARDG